MEYIHDINEALLYVYNNIFVKTDEIDYRTILQKCDKILFDLDHIDHHGNTYVLKDYVASIRLLISTDRANESCTDIVYALSELVYLCKSKIYMKTFI